VNVTWLLTWLLMWHANMDIDMVADMDVDIPMWQMTDHVLMGQYEVGQIFSAC
jgi:hypothetical protein